MSNDARAGLWSLAAREQERQGFWYSLGRWWCRTMHGSISWPMRGYYHCQRCGRIYQMPWP